MTPGLIEELVARKHSQGIKQILRRLNKDFLKDLRRHGLRESRTVLSLA